MNKMRIINTLIVLWGLLLIFPQQNIAQESRKVPLTPSELKKREKLYKKVQKEIDKNASFLSSAGRLKGQNGNISSLESSYCSTGGSDNIVPDSWDPAATGITWDVYTKDSGGDISHPGWYEIQGTGTNTVLVFYPDRVPSNYFGDVIVFAYTQTDGIGGVATSYDFTYVYQTPTAFSFGPANAVICGGESTVLTLQLSENGMEYFLYKDGVQVSPLPTSGDGNPLTFTVSEAGDYTVEARNTIDNACSNTMSGTATVTVNPSPIATAGSDSPKCEGDDLNLTGSASNGTPAYSYSWSGPNSFTSTEQNPTINGVVTAHTGQFTLTVTDSKGCSDTDQTDVVVNENPVAVATNSGPVCVGGNLTLTTTVTGGLAPYTFSWTGPDGFTSTDKDPVINNVTLAKAGVYQVTVTDANNCGSTTVSTTVVINTLPVVSPINDGPVCEFGTLQLTSGADDNGATPYTFSWTGPLGYTSTTENPAISNIALNQDGSYSVVATDQNGCSSISVSTTVVVNDAPIAVASNDGPVCEGGTLNLSGSATEGTGAYTYSWTGPNGFTSNQQNPQIVNIALAAAGTYTLTVDDGTCTDVTTTDVIVNANPTITASNDGPVCENGTLTLSSTPLSGSGVYTFGWTGPGGYTSTDQNPVINPIIQTQAGIYQVNVSDDNGCVSVVTASTTVVVNENPTVTPGSDSPVCEDETLHLGASPLGGNGVYTYSWTGPVGYTSTNKDPIISNILLTQAGDYDVIVTDGNLCSSAMSTTTVVVNDAPVATAINDGPVCEGGTLTLSGSAIEGTGAYTYSWTGPNGFTSLQQNPVIANITLAAAGTYTLTVNDGNCTDVTTTIVVVNSSPTLTADNDGPVCEKTTLNLTSTPIGGSGVYTFSWTGPNGFTSSNQNPVINSVTVLNDGVYQVTVTDNNGCGNIVAANTTVVIYPAPSVTALNNSPLCEDETLDLTANASGGTNPLSFSWTGPQGYTSANQNPSITNILVNQAGDYEVIVSDANSCTDTSLTTVVVNKVTAGISISTPPVGTVICAGTPVTFNALGSDGSGDYNFDFHIVSGGVDNSVQNSTSVAYTTSSLTDGDEVYVIVIDNTTGCTNQSTSITMTVNPNPVVVLSITSPGGNTVCNGSDVVFETTAGYFNYVYYVNNVEVQNGTSNTYSTNLLNDGDEVYVQVTSGANCSAAAPHITMTVFDLPTAGLTADTGTDIIAGTNVTFTATGGVQYQFFVNGIEVQAQSADDTYSSNTLVDGDVVSVNVYNANGCVSTAILTMSVMDAISLLDVSASATDYCAGSGGVSIYIATPQDGITYELIRTSDNAIIGTITHDGTNAVQWDNILGTEEYKVEGYYISVPSSRVEMNNRITVTENPLPNKYSILPTGDVTGCGGGAGHEIKLEDSDIGVSYQLLMYGGNVGTPVAGTGSEITFGFQRIFGLYTILATDDATLCSEVMSNTFEIKPDGTYNVYDVTGDGHFCAGDAGASVVLGGSDDGVDYHVLRDGVDIGDIWTAGGTAGHTFGPYNVVGSYTVIVNTTTGCRYPMNGSVDVIEVALPASFDLMASNNGHYCIDDAVGVNITIEGQENGINYQLYRDGVLVTTVTGTVDDANAPLSFGNYNVAGRYSVMAVTPVVGCMSAMNNEIDLIADPLPVVYDISSDGDYCTGSVTYLHLNGSEADVLYRWEREGDVATGAWVNGTGGLLDFEITGTDTYYITAQRDDGVTSCTTEMNGRFPITEKPFADLTKTLRIKAGTGTNCSDGAVVIVENSELGVVYELAKGGVRTGNIVTGDGNDVEFPDPVIDTGATYTVFANINGCEDILNNTIFINVPGAIEQYGVTGAGDICNGDPGVVFGLDGSEAGVLYSLYLVDGNGPGSDKQIGGAVAGTGNAITFDLANEEGEYYVLGNNGVDCEMEMLNRVTLTVNPLPIAFKMIGSGFFCDLADGAEIGINGSEHTVDYTLQFDDGSGKLNWANAIGGLTGDTIIFGKFTDIGSYTVVAITEKGCTSSMNGEVVVTQKPAPQDFTVLAQDTAYCDNNAGVELWMQHSEADIVYSVYDDTDNLIIEVTGDGSDSLSLGIFMQGRYSVVGAYGGDACETDMNGGDDVVITEIPTPVKFYVSVSSTNVCGSTGTDVLLDGSENGRYYYILADGVNLNDTITGTDNPISWHVNTAITPDTISYEIIAISAGKCDLSMGIVEVIYKNSPSAFNMITENDISQYCTGEPGIIIGLDSSQVDIGYQLVNEFSDIVDFTVGDGDTIYFNNPHMAGRYIVNAIDFSSGCSNEFTDAVTIVENPMPIVYNFCCTGYVNTEELVLDGSEIGVIYSLLINDTAFIPPVDSLGTSNFINYGTKSLGGVYSVLATATGGCSALMNGTARLYEFPLIAINDMMSLSEGELIGEISVVDNDILLNGIDSLLDPGKNIYFKLDTSWIYLDDNNIGQQFTTIGEVSINDEGKFEYKKLPSFYGRDSVRYIIYNTSYPERIDTATVFIFVGNVDLGEGRSFIIPNAFSPNGDGINDKFVITGVEDKQESKFEVFNRWGTRVYRSKGQNYDNEWEGKSTESSMVSAGDDLPNGTYFYVFSVKVNLEGEVVTKEYSGYIELRR